MRPLVAVALATVTASCATTANAPTGPADGAGAATVVRVLDGDSLVLDGADGEIEARLIGVNAPERDECWGEEARAALDDLVGGRSVTWDTDVEPRDQYDRMLVYLWGPDGRLVNETLTAAGHALARAFPPNTTRQGAIDAAGDAAEAAGLGLWSACRSDRAGLDLVAVEANPPGPDEDALADEWVSFGATTTLDLSGWTLRDGSTANRFVFPDGTTLEPGTTLTVRTGCGADTATDLHWCSETPVWNNSGDEILVLDDAGLIVLAETYGP